MNSAPQWGLDQLNRVGMDSTKLDQFGIEPSHALTRPIQYQTSPLNRAKGRVDSISIAESKSVQTDF